MTTTAERLNDRFERLDQIGEGGMGVVFRAQDHHTGQLVAIKQLHPHIIDQDPDLVERFRREAEILRRLNHPNIVQVIDTFEDAAQQFIVMEYVSGGSLRGLLDQEGALNVGRTLHILLEVADALARAHHLHIIHRDIKPANVLLAADGTPRLSDFGVARMTDRPHLTRNDALIGTPHYLAPEALQQQGIDERGDIWALGVLLFEMLTGSLPFQGSSLFEIITAILSQPVPDLEALRPDLPLALVDLLYRMLEKEPATRMPSVRRIGAELEAILREGQTWDTTDQWVSAPARRALQFDSTPKTGHPCHNLPAQTTPFVGRTHELDHLETLLSSPTTRLITILGPGGIGKTRLALACAARLIDQADHEVFFVSLAPLLSAEHIVPTIADAIGLRMQPGQTPQQQLIGSLRDRQLVLVLDNFESVIDGATLIAQLLEAAPGIRALVTSREKLNLQGEVLYGIEGMDVPKHVSDAHALNASAVQLFLQSARRVMPAFQIRPIDLPHIIRICQLVAGHPLGILLAAAWVEVLSPQEIEAEIRRSLDFLETDLRDMPERHRSLRTIFESTWQQLDAVTQEIYVRLAVFRGSFTRDAAQTIAAASLRQLAVLVNKSLLRRDLAGQYSLHALLQQFAAQRLEASAESSVTYARHSAYYANVLSGEVAAVRDLHDRTGAYTVIEAAIENIHQGWQWAAEYGSADIIALYVRGLWEYYETRSWYLGGVEMVTAYHKAAHRLAEQSPLDAEQRYSLGLLHESLGHLYSLKGKYVEATDHYQAALPLLEAHEHVRCARLHRQIGNQQRLQHQHDAALFSYAAAEATLGEETGHHQAEWWHEWVQIQLERSWIYYWAGDWQRFSTVEGNVRSLVEQHGSLAQQVNFFNCLTGMALRRSRYITSEDALVYSRIALEKSVSLNNPADIAWSQFTRGMCLLWHGTIHEAVELFQNALGTAQRYGDSVHQARCLTYLTIAFRKQRLVEAVQAFAGQSLEAARTAHLPEYVGLAYGNWAWAAWANANMADAARYVQQALTAWENLESNFASLAWQWVVLWPKMAVMLQTGQTDQAVDCARSLLHASQQPQPSPAATALEQAIQAWEQHQPDVARIQLYTALRESGDYPTSADGLISQAEGVLAADALTIREREILRLMAVGLSNEEIAERLVVGVSTVKKHINHIFSKLGVTSRTRAIAHAKELRLI